VCHQIPLLFLYISGFFLRRIAKVVNADVHAVHRRILDYGRANYEKPQPKGVAAVVELDEIWHFLNAKKTKFGYESLLSRTPVSLSTVHVESKITLHLRDFTKD
jgi:hypothetical protein